MIVVTLELKSANGRDRDRHLGKVVVSNDGTGTTRLGNYNVGGFIGSSKRIRLARVEKFPRRRSGLELLRRALNALHQAKALP